MIDNQFENFMNSITISKYKQAYFMEIYQGFCGLCGKTSRFYSAVVNPRFVTKKTLRDGILGLPCTQCSILPIFVFYKMEQ